MATAGAEGGGTGAPRAPRPPGRGRPRIRKPAAERRQEILVAAGSLIATRGFNGLASQDVAEACGLTVPGLLHHFPHKTALLVAVLEDRDRRDMESVGALHADHRHDPVRLLEAVVERSAGQPEVVRLYAVLGAEASDPAHPAHPYFRRRYRRAVRFVAGLLRGRVAEPVPTARQVIAAMDGLQLQWLSAGEGFDLVEAWRWGSRRFLSEGAGRHPGATGR
ncbi:TetR/AcrR family transcriptional regulator [Streptacidiphilus sp. ASG 303]|uniref:TetR/AcrR family transcriptional regulator n=1 Tax=Streptacidiphilus sp. ASG 303 TaxID=2896847 RepID=UPI001E2FAE55|nr:TetR/AcrR family transcriptional regulator [Streptacidiphilus sp. ASG 303]MCD0483582.1 TetR/AcrR family transcriptional regulator [Streptacidiphilus sp. ASG 303]